MVRSNQSKRMNYSRRRRITEISQEHQSDPEVGVDVPASRFEYNPRNLMQRIFVSAGFKTKLASSAITEVPYRKWLRWILVLLLALVTIFLTPQLVPKWLGFHLSTPSDLCRRRESKLHNLGWKMENMSKVHEGILFLHKAEAALKCMNESASKYWTGISRVFYPDECIPSNAQAATKELENCVEPVCSEVCVDFIFKRMVCKNKCTERKCTRVSIPDPNSERNIAEVTAYRNLNNLEVHDVNVTISALREISGTADKTVQAVLKRLVFQIDLASNLYIIYTMISIAVGIPIVVYKRALSSRLLRLTLGLRKSHFILLVIFLLSVWDIGHKVFARADIQLLLKNLKNDPCYLDPQFSEARLTLIKQIGANVTKQKVKLDKTFTSMTKVFYDAILCEVCKVDTRGQDSNPMLVFNIGRERELYSAGNTTGYEHPASCNATRLNSETLNAPESGMSFAEAFLASGIIAQIILKAVLSSWFVHMFGYIEPMVTHAGKVEIFGISEAGPVTLSATERKSVKMFARDKHLLPLLVFSILLTWEVVVIVYSVTKTKESSLTAAAVNRTLIVNTSASIGTCYQGILHPH